MDTQDQNMEVNTPGFVAPSTSAIQPEIELTQLPGSPTEPEISLNTDNKKDTQQQKHLSPFRESMQRFRRDIRAMISLGCIIFFVILAIFGPPIYQHIGGPIKTSTGTTQAPDVYRNPFHGNFERSHEGPSADYWLGTDGIGRDILARLMQGLLISITLAVMVEIVNVTLGIFFGVLAGFYGGWIDQVLARFADVMFAFPGTLFLILLAGSLGPWADSNLSNIPVIGPNGNARLLLVSVGLAFTAWPLMARYVRGQTLQLKEQQFVEAAKTSGATEAQIIVHHIVPNLISIVLTAASLDISGTIIGEAGLSYLGLGVQIPGSSLGLMVEQGRNVLTSYPTEALIPALTLVIIVLAFSFIGDGLRDAFDPRSKD